MSPRDHALRTPAWLTTPRVRSVAGTLLTVGAVLLVWFALVAPNQLDRLAPGAFVRIPLEGLALAGLALVLPVRARRVVAVLAGVTLGAILLVKLLDLGFYDVLNRPFNPVTDLGALPSAAGVLSDSIGHAAALTVVVVAVAGAVSIVVLVPLSLLRLLRLTAEHRATATRALALVSTAWLVCAALGAEVGGAPLASSSAAGLAYHRVEAVRAALHEQHAFAAALHRHDPFAATPGSDLLTGLRGKDVLVVFVESYGQVAVQGTSFSPPVDAVLEDGTRALRAAGFGSRSAFLTSPTFGGISWLAHSTLQSGLWVDNQRSYGKLVASERFTLSAAFKRAGWRTVGDSPANRAKWPEGTSFYHYDQLYHSGNVGYAGPKFSYATMPDQYTLAAFQRRELAPTHRRPVMAEIDLVSSHTPWAPLPRMVDPARLGDGSVFDPMPAQGRSPRDVWRHAGQVQAAYGQSIQYSLQALISFVQTSRDDNLVLVVLGDHQPSRIVSGAEANHNVPVSVIARDPHVLDRISAWGWGDGLLPGPHAPVWRMDSFRDRFLTAFGPRPAALTAPTGR